MNKAKISKYIEYGTTKLKILYKEKKFQTENCSLKYILEKNNSGNLVVVFSGIPRPGLKARYNYNRTLKNIKANRLFILDDFGYDQRGAYYLGKDKKFEVQTSVKALITEIKEKLNIKNTLYVGSSKGGYAALLFGIRDKNSTIIAGSLQYLLGNYITANKRRKENIMKYVMGKDYDQKDIEFLNNLLKKEIRKNKDNKCAIHLHYSKSEYTYLDHMIYLLEDLRKYNIKFSEDIGHYTKHEEIAYYFPQFLVNKINDYCK